MAKREINAKDFMRDFHAGTDDVGLMKKYLLTPKGLDGTLRKLLSAGLISGAELDARRSGQEETVSLSGIRTALQEHHGVRRLQRQKSRYSYSGRVEGVDILDYIQWLLIEGRRTVLEVRPLDGMVYTFFVEDGRVVHATSGDMDGEEAFYRCVRSERGEFIDLPWSAPKRFTIEKPGMQLLFEAARRRDEADVGTE